MNFYKLMKGVCMKKCDVCLIQQGESEFPLNQYSEKRSNQCLNCGLVRSRFWSDGISPLPNEVIRLIVRSQVL